MLQNTHEIFKTSLQESRKMVAPLEGIAGACRDQAYGVEQISKALSEMDSVVQQNAANAEHSASASEEMNAQATHLMGIVDYLSGLIDGEGADSAHDNGKKAGGVSPMLLQRLVPPASGPSIRKSNGTRGNNRGNGSDGEAKSRDLCCEFHERERLPAVLGEIGKK